MSPARPAPARRHVTARALPVALALALAPGLARADIPPPPRNEGCTVELVEKGGLECVEEGSTRDPERWARRGFERRCALYRSRHPGDVAEPGSLWCRQPLATSRAGAAADGRGEADGGAPGLPPSPPRADALAALARGTGAFAAPLSAATYTWTAGQNEVTSPLGLWSALATASAAARGTTAAELRRGLALEGPAAEGVAAARALAEDVRRRNPGFTLSTVWLLDDVLRPGPDLLALSVAAGARVDAADLRRHPGDTVLRLDRWIARETRGRLDRVVPPRALYGTTRVAIASAGGLASAWPDAFAPAAPLRFYVASRGTGRRWNTPPTARVPAALKDVPAVRATGTFAAASLDGMVVVDLPLAGGLAVTLLVPHAVADAPRQVGVPIADLLARLRPRRLQLTVPVLAVDAPPASLGDRLAGVGVATPFRDAFDPRDGDVSGVAAGAGGERLVLGELFHRAFLDLRAPGAGAPPAGAHGSAEAPAASLVLDHPFAFAVRDVASGVVLLSGVVKDPAPAVPERVADVVRELLGPVGRVGAPVVTVGATRVEGRARVEKVREEVDLRLDDVTSCYAQQLVLEPTLRGTVVVRWTIDGNGMIGDVKIDRAGTRVASEDLRACLVGRVARWSSEAGRGTIVQAWTLAPPRASAAPASAEARYAHRYAKQPGERCRPFGAQEALGRVDPGAGAPLPQRTADLQIIGPLDERAVRKVIAAHAGEVRRAYEQRLAQDRRLQGTVAIEWMVDREGRAGAARVDCSATTLDDTFIFEAIKARIESWRFPRPRGGAITTVNHRWTFVPLSLAGPR